MYIKSISYTDTNWELRDLVLGQLNLIVGRNAVGKSRTLSTIDLLVKMITQKRDLNWGSKWLITFVNSQEQIIQYEFRTSTSKKGVISEKITVNNEVMLTRNSDDKAKIKAIDGSFKWISPPADKLVLHVHRDVNDYPFLEEIANWAKNAYGFKFGNISPMALLNKQEYDLLTTVDEIPLLLKDLNAQSKQRIITEFNEIGYHISSISVRDMGDGKPLIFIKEDNVEKAIPHYKLSQGMFRTLAIIVFLEYLTTRQQPTTVIIDDLCEGLDYAKATKLGEMIFEKCRTEHIQLIVTSNDSFLMDVIDIEEWNILRRTGKTVSSLNFQTYPEIFERFRFTGLSNFDLFSSNYLNRYEKV